MKIYYFGVPARFIYKRWWQLGLTTFWTKKTEMKLLDDIWMSYGRRSMMYYEGH
jgi:hypothetical protein